VEVEPDQLSLAIGRQGQNVRLASKLLGYKINISSTQTTGLSLEEQIRERLLATQAELSAGMQATQAELTASVQAAQAAQAAAAAEVSGGEPTGDGAEAVPPPAAAAAEPPVEPAEPEKH
jgi:N utilization substance protein A